MANLAQRNFAGGELAPALYARTDVVKYQTGLRTLRNFLIQKHGGAANRPGTRYVAEVKNSAVPGRLIPFVFNTAQTYVIELGNQVARFHQNGAPVVVAGVAAWSNATPYVPGDIVVLGGVNYYCVLAHTNQVPPNATYWYPLTGNILEIPTPWLAADLMDLDVAQSADVVTFVHPSYPPYELKRLGNTDWTLSPVILGTAQRGVTNPIAAGGTAGPTTRYAITAVSANGEESLVANSFLPVPYDGAVVIAATPSTATPINLTWTAEPTATYYNIYRGPDGATWGFIGTSTGTSFSDNGLAVDFLNSPPQKRVILNNAGNFPSAVAIYQQRRLFANSNNEPEKIWTSRIGQFRNFLTSFPIRDDDALTFQLAGRTVNAVKHLLDLGRLVVFTTAGEWIVEGNDAGVLLPTAINPRQYGYAGSGRLAPIVVVDTALYVQARGNLVRDLRRAIQQGFDSSDLTIFAAHLFDGYTIADWAYAQTPHSVIWAVRDDGTLLGLTYLREQDVWGWHRHDTDGAFENVCVVPEGSEDAVYVIVRRTINGATKRYVERFMARSITARTDIRDLVFLDASLAYDGRNAGGETMTISGGSSWANGELLTLTRSSGGFSASDVVNGTVIQLTAADGSELRFSITSYTSGTVVQGFVNRTAPVDLRGIATGAWARAAKVITGLGHLEGKAVSVFADGYVISSPNNADYPTLTVASGQITLPRAYAVVQVGLPYMSDFETLDIDTASGRSLKESKMHVGAVGLTVEASRGIFAGRRAPESDALNVDGDPLYELFQAKIRESEAYDSPIALLTGDVDVTIESNWDSSGRVFVRQVDPVPLTILSVRPTGLLPIA